MPDSSRMLGQRIRELRKRKGLTQEQLGEMSNVGAKYISLVERSGANVTLTLAENIANGLEVELKDLFDFAHAADPEHLKAELNALINNAAGDQLLTAYRVLKSILV